MSELDPSTAAVIRDLARKVHELDLRTRSQARASQARDRSLEGGTQRVYDEDGELVLEVGDTGDRTTYTLTEYGGPTPEAPSVPLIAQFPGGATITWDGYDWKDEQSWPPNFARVSIHLSTLPGEIFTDLEDLNDSVVATIEGPAGGAVSIAQPSDVTTYCTLVAWTRSGLHSVQSLEAEVVGGALPDEVPPVAPVDPPTLMVRGLADSFLLSIEPIDQQHVVTYHMAAGEDPIVPSAANALPGMPTRQTNIGVSTLPDGTPLSPDLAYSFVAVLSHPDIPGSETDPSVQVTSTLNLDAISHLFATLVQAGLVDAGRVQVGNGYWDPDEGLVLPQPNGDLTQLTTDGVTPSQLAGFAVLLGAVVRDNLSLFGLSTLFGVLQAAAGITAPNQAPSQQNHWPALLTDAANSFPDFHFGLTDNVIGDRWVMAYGLVGDGGVLEVSKATGDQVWNTPMPDYQITGGITRIGSAYYTLGQDFAWDHGGDWYIRKYNMSMEYMGDQRWSGWESVPKTPAIGNDGAGNLTIAYSRANGAMRVVTREADDINVLIDTFDLDVGGNQLDVAGVYRGAADFGATRIVVMPRNVGTFVFNAAGTARVTSQEWSRPAGKQPRGLHWDGTRFRAYAADGNIYDFARVPSAVVAVAAATNVDLDVSDPDGGGPEPPSATHETTVGASLAWTRPARTHAILTFPPPPDAGNIDPNQRDKANRTGVYVGPTLGSVKWQAYLAVGVNQYVLDVADTGTADPPGANGFTGVSAPGIYQSTKADALGKIIYLPGTGEGRAGPSKWNVDGKSPHAELWTTSVQTIATNTWVKRTGFTVIDADSPTVGFTYANGDFTVLEAGLYVAMFTLQFDNVANARRLGRVAKNGVEIIRDEAVPSSAVFPTVRGAHPVWCDAGDVLCFELWQDTGANVSTTALNQSNRVGIYRVSV